MKRKAYVEQSSPEILLMPRIGSSTAAENGTRV